MLLGAGVFLANSALSIRREEALLYEALAIRCQGWLGQGDFAFALAAFLHLFPQPGGRRGRRSADRPAPRARALRRPEALV